METKETNPDELTPRTKFIYETFPKNQMTLDDKSSVSELPIFDNKYEMLKSANNQNNCIEQGETILDDYSCALKKSILIQGTMYISNQALYFHSYFNDSIMFLSKVGTKFKILISDIKDVVKAKNAVIFDNSIELYLMNG